MLHKAQEENAKIIEKVVAQLRSTEAGGKIPTPRHSSASTTARLIRKTWPSAESPISAALLRRT